MGFRELVQWIMGAPPPEVAAPTSVPNRRRFLRVGVDDAAITVAGVGSFPISNISFGGCRLNQFDAELVPDFPPGRVFAGVLQLQGSTLEMKLKVCNHIDQAMGCAFVDATPAQSRAISDFIKPRMLGSSLREIKVASKTNLESGVTMRWFQGEEGAQVILWETAGGDTQRGEVYFMNYVVAWAAGTDKVRTGTHREGSRGGTALGQITPDAVAFFHVPSHRALKLGKQVLEAADLPAAAKLKLIREIGKEERRLYDRFIFRPGDPPMRFYPTRDRATPLTVINLSFRGISMLLDGDTHRDGFTPGRWCEGDLEIGGRTIPARIKVVFCNEGQAGGLLDVVGEENIEILAQFLAPRLLGQSLEEVAIAPDELPFIPPEARIYLHLGIHNTHVLTAVKKDHRLVLGRLVYNDQIMVFERERLAMYTCPFGVVFSRDWILPPEARPSTRAVSEYQRFLAREITQSGNLPEEVRLAWRTVLDPPATATSATPEPTAGVKP